MTLIVNQNINILDKYGDHSTNINVIEDQTDDRRMVNTK